MKLGYTLLYVDNVEETMTFYSNAFGLEESFLHESKAYGEMKTGETKLGGPILPLFAKMLPPFDKFFEDFAHDKKKHLKSEKS